MRPLLVVLSVVEVLLVVVVLVYYLLAIARSLRRTAGYLAKVSFGVRAIETQCAPVGPSVVAINERLTGVAAALEGLTALAAGPSDSVTVAGTR